MTEGDAAAGWLPPIHRGNGNAGSIATSVRRPRNDGRDESDAVNSGTITTGGDNAHGMLVPQ